MDRKIALSISLAVMVVLGAVATLSVFSFTAQQPTEASNLPTRDLTLGEINTETFAPIVATAGITGTLTMAAASTRAGAITSYTLTFKVDPDGGNLDNGVDEIIIIWDEDFKNFPNVISTSAVSIRAVGDGGGCGNDTQDLPSCGVTGPAGNEGQSVATEKINVEFVPQENSADLLPQTRLRIPDMDTDDNTGGNGIRAGATVTVVFRQQAGISNPTENNDNYHTDVRLTTLGVDPGGRGERAVPDLFIQARMQPSNDDGKRGRSFTVVATGIEGNESITFFRDGNGDGVRQKGERDLCSVVADRDDTATCTFTISNPPFVPGKGDDCVLPVLSNCNFINFVDSDGRSTTGELGKALDATAVDRQTFELDQTIIASPSTVHVGDTIVISLLDWPSNKPLTKITLAKIEVTLPSPIPNTDSSGEVSFDFKLPRFGKDGTTRIPTGKIRLKVFVSGVDEDTNITFLEVTPTTDGLAPLGSNLVRIWGHDGSTQTWQVFDPAIPDVSDLVSLIDGQGYFLKIMGDQTVILNGKQRVLFAGWNLIGW